MLANGGQQREQREQLEPDRARASRQQGKWAPLSPAAARSRRRQPVGLSQARLGSSRDAAAADS